MSVATTSAPLPAEAERLPAAVRRSRVLGIIYLVLAALVVWVFGLSAEGDSTFRLSRGGESLEDLKLTLPAAGFCYVVAAALAFLGATEITKGLRKRSDIALLMAILLFVFAFLAWAAAGESFSLVGMFEATVLRTVPITIGALAGIMCERVAVVNIAIEGQLLTGAFVGAIVGSAIGSGWGLLAASLSGALLSWVLAVLAIKYLVNQIIIGVVINLFALGLTSFITARILTQEPHLNSASVLGRYDIPLLADIPFFGPILFQQSLFVYISWLLVAGVWFLLWKTRWGLRARAVGEHPKAADTLGIDVFKVRYINVILGGAIAGIGGAYFTLGSVGRFDENMTGGRGFIALAAMIFGRWHPVGALAAALLFGFADAIQQKVAILDTPYDIPSEFLLALPYIATIVVVAGVVGRSRMPAADGEPYVKE